MNKVNRIWKHIQYDDVWNTLNTSALDDISKSWFDRRAVLVDNSKEYEEFMERLKRRHAIETGVVERMYDVEKGITETLIKEGFHASLVSHGDTDIDKDQFLKHLNDHLAAVDYIFDVVKEDRPLSKGFLLELHQLTTRHQEHAEGRDQFGNKTKIPLLKGKFKVRENNPTRSDGTVVLYCPPEHVDSEMDRLFSIYHELELDETHPLLIASWFHHAFTVIHPFQDGNGRVVRLMASLILIKHNLFPITVLREEAKEKYIAALERADEGAPQDLVTYFAGIQRRNIEQALNLKEVAGTSLLEVTEIFKSKAILNQREFEKTKTVRLNDARKTVFDICSGFLNDYREKLEDPRQPFSTYIHSGRPDDENKQDYHYRQIVSYAKEHDYFFNAKLPRSFVALNIALEDQRQYEIGVTVHHYGYDDGTLAIGAFLDYKGSARGDSPRTTYPVAVRPYIISINDDIQKLKEYNVNQHLEELITVAIAQIASEL